MSSKLDLLCLIRTARELHSENPQLLSNNRVNVTPALLDITKKKAVSSLSGLVDPDPVTGEYPIKIARINKADFRHVHSAVFIERKRAIIEFPSALNTCWSRFCIAKELIHLLTGLADGDPRPVSLNLKLAKNSRFNLPRHENQEMDDETFCFYLAIEVMLPWQMREELIDLHQKGTPPRLMAERFMIPMAVVEHFFEGDSNGENNYCSLSFRLNRNI